MIKIKLIFLKFLLLLVMLTSCTNQQENSIPANYETLQTLGIENPTQFASLPSCEQVEIYTIIGSQNLDMDHAVAIVPQWINIELARGSKEEIAVCIGSQGNLLADKWKNTFNSENLNIAYKVLALVYKADDLDLLENSSVRQFVNKAVCIKGINYKENIALIYYSKPGDVPSPEKLVSVLCN